MPTFMKSTTLPWSKRSIQFDAPPAMNSARPADCHSVHRSRKANRIAAANMIPVPMVKIAVRALGGRLDPTLRKPPVFSEYVSRTVSARNDCVGFPASTEVAMCFVTRSHPTVARMAINNANRVTILFGKRISSISIQQEFVVQSLKSAIFHSKYCLPASVHADWTHDLHLPFTFLIGHSLFLFIG